MSARRGWGQDGIFFEHDGPCRDSERHRHCQGRWRGVISLGFGADGKRIRRKVSGKTKAIVQDRLKTLHGDLDTGIKASPNYTLRRAAEDWLTEGLNGRSAKTIKKNENVLTPILATIGARRLRELTAAEVHQALTTMAARYSSAAVVMGHNALTRAIRHAEARDLVGRNVATLVETPKGQAGRPSKSLSLEQASALLAAAKDTRMHAYIALCLATGIRTEEARALRWEHVDFGDPVANPPVPASAAVWRSVRSHGDTKTEKSRRTLALPEMAVNALWAHRTGQADDRAAAGMTWSDRDLVFSTRTGGPLDAANVRREFRTVCAAAKIGEHWTPRELRHSFAGTQLAEGGAQIQTIMAILGHRNASMSATYSHISDPVLREQYEKVIAAGGRVAGPAAEALLSNQINQDTLDWLKTNYFKTELELGHCLRTPAEGPCECDLYLRCPKFFTTSEYAPRLQARLARERQLIQDAVERGWPREAERHTAISTRICDLLTDLGEAPEPREGNS